MLLLDTLGVVIAFATVMLMLSLVVTALVQGVGHLLGLRAGNLEKGVKLTLENVLGQPEPEAKAVAQSVVRRPQILETTTATPPAEGAAPPAPGLLVKSRTPPLTWIEPEHLPQLVQTSGGPALSPEQQGQVIDVFQRLDPYLRGRFAYHIRLCSIAVSMVVAFAFQVSAPDLLSELSTNVALRDALVAQAEGALAQAETILANQPRHEDVAEQALDVLRQRHTDLATPLEEVSGLGDTKQLLVDEMRTVLSEVDGDHEAVVQEYSGLLDRFHKEALSASLETAAEVSHSLGRMNVRYWPHGWGFYRDVGNWVGVIMTGILLTLGAPFWYELLGNMLKLKDILSQKPPAGAAPTRIEVATLTAERTNPPAHGAGSGV